MDTHNEKGLEVDAAAADDEINEQTLEQLEREGLVESRSRSAEGRKEYRLTDAGKQHVEQELLPRIAREPLALRLPPERPITDTITLYFTGVGAEGIGVELNGGTVHWLDTDDARSLARGILARLEPEALLPRTLKKGEIRNDASREELVAMARSIVLEDPRRTLAMRKTFGAGVLDGLNHSLEGMGLAPATLEELL